MEVVEGQLMLCGWHGWPESVCARTCVRMCVSVGLSQFNSASGMIEELGTAFKNTTVPFRQLSHV